MQSIRPLRFVIAGAVLALAAGCTTSAGSQSGSTQPAGSSVVGGSGQAETAEQTYKLGVGLPATGAAAGYGAEYLEVVKMGVEEANKQYAADGIKIEIVSADTQATAEGGATAANKLGAVEKAPVVLTAWSAVVAAMQPVAKDLGFALFNAGAQSPSLIGLDNVVNLLPMNDAQLAGFADYLVNTKGYKTFGTIFVDNESGQGTAEAFKGAVEALGATVIAEESIRQDATDAATQIGKIEAAAPDFVYVQTLLVEGAAVFKSAREAGMTIPMGSYTGVGEARLIRDAGQDRFNGLLYMSHMPADTAGVEALLTDLQARLPGVTLVNQSYDAYFYAVPFLYAEVIKRLRAEGAPVTGDNVLALLRTAKDLEVPIIGTMDLTDKLTFRSDPGIREVVDYALDPLQDTVVDTSGSTN